MVRRYLHRAADSQYCVVTKARLYSASMNARLLIEESGHCLLRASGPWEIPHRKPAVGTRHSRTAHQRFCRQISLPSTSRIANERVHLAVPGTQRMTNNSGITTPQRRPRQVLTIIQRARFPLRTPSGSRHFSTEREVVRQSTSRLFHSVI